jgi:hypothetical protein
MIPLLLRIGPPIPIAFDGLFVNFLSPLIQNSPHRSFILHRQVRDGIVHNEGFIFKDGHKWRPFGISYRCVIPKRQEATNLFSPTCPSSSHVGYGSSSLSLSKSLFRHLKQNEFTGALRLEHQFYSMGQACAHAADLAIRQKSSVQEVEYGELKERLLNDGVKIDVSVVGVPTFPDEQ